MADLVLVAMPHLVMVVMDAVIEVEVVTDGRVAGGSGAEGVGLGRAAGGGGGGSAVPGARPRPLGVALGPEARDRDITACAAFICCIKDQFGIKGTRSLRFLLGLILAQYMFFYPTKSSVFEMQFGAKGFCCVWQEIC